MTPKQRRFVQEYAVDGNGAAAAVRAGYAPGSAKVTASRLLTRDNVRQALAVSQQRVARRLEITRDDVVRGLLEGIEMSRMQGDPSGMIAGWREVGKLLGFYAPVRQQVEVTAYTQRVICEMEAMSDEQLMTLAAGGTIN